MDNLYKIRNVETNAVVAFITARTKPLAISQYHANGGKCVHVVAEQMSYGYPNVIQTVIS